MRAFFRFRFLAVIPAAILFTVLIPAEASASYLAFGPQAATFGAGAANDPVNLGMVFDISSSITVDELGIYDLNSLATSEVVTLYDSGGNSLASVTVLLTDPETNGYLMHAITPVVLGPGTYTVSAFTGNNTWDYQSVAPMTGAGITFDFPDYAYGSSPAAPTQNHVAPPAGPYYGPNFDIVTSNSAVPEPGTWTFLAAGIGLLGVAKWRRRVAQ